MGLPGRRESGIVTSIGGWAFTFIADKSWAGILGASKGNVYALLGIGLPRCGKVGTTGAVGGFLIASRGAGAGAFHVPGGRLPGGCGKVGRILERVVSGYLYR